MLGNGRTKMNFIHFLYERCVLINFIKILTKGELFEEKKKKNSMRWNLNTYISKEIQDFSSIKKKNNKNKGKRSIGSNEFYSHYARALQINFAKVDEIEVIKIEPEK